MWYDKIHIFRSKTLTNSTLAPSSSYQNPISYVGPSRRLPDPELFTCRWSIMLTQRPFAVKFFIFASVNCRLITISTITRPFKFANSHIFIIATLPVIVKLVALLNRKKLRFLGGDAFCHISSQIMR